MNPVFPSVPARRLAIAAALAWLVSGCTTVMPVPVAGAGSSSSGQVLRAANLVPMGLGQFKLGAGLPPQMDAELSGGMRGSNLVAPGGSYSRHLRQTLAAELQSAGLLDMDAKAVVEGQLLAHQVDAAIGTGTARLVARFQVLLEGRQVFDKELAVEDSWSSSFVGAVAIPLAQERYSALYPKMIARLVSDPDFRRVLAR